MVGPLLHNLSQFYLENLVLNGPQTVPDDWFKMVENPYGDFQEPTPEREGYTFQFWVPHNYDQEFQARGAFGQYL